MATKSAKIKYALEHNPLLIPTLLKDTSIPKGMIYGIMKRTLPCRIGIEFELAECFGLNFIKSHPELIMKDNNIDKMLTSYYKVLEIRSDDLMQEVTPDQITTQNIPLQEIRISIVNYKQLKGLYKFMEDLPKYCKLHSNGGIHIHVDLSSYAFRSTRKEYEIQNYIKHRLPLIAKIFPKYKGKYNRYDVGIQRKATWVNISRLQTLEFRIAPLTFSYSEIIQWIFKVIKFRQNLIHECRLKPKEFYEPESSMDEEASNIQIIPMNDGSVTSYITSNSTSSSSGSPYQLVTSASSL